MAFRLLLEKIPFFLLAALASAVSLKTQAGAIQHDFSFLSRLAVVPLHYAFYLIKTVFPFHLTPFYYSIAFTWGGFLPFALLFAALFVSAWRHRLTHPAWAIGILAFFGLFVPVVGFFHVGIHHIADRYAYLPAIGLSIAAVPLLSSPSRFVRFPFLVLSMLALAAAAVITLHILPTWSSTEAFFARAGRYAPDHPFVVVDQAKKLISLEGDYARAEELLDKALATPSKSPDAYLCKALCVDERLGPRAALDALLELPVKEFNSGCCYDAAQYALRAGLWETARRFSCVGRSLVAPSSYYVGDFLELDFAAACLSEDAETLAAVVRQAAELHPDPARRAYFQTHSDFSLPDLMPFYQLQWARLHRADAWRFFQFLVPLAEDNPWNLRTIAGLFATAEGWSPVPPGEILSIAQRAAELAPDEPNVLDILAAAQANAGDFPAAVETASRALSLSPPSSPLADEISAHLALFRSGKSLRQ